MNTENSTLLSYHEDDIELDNIKTHPVMSKCIALEAKIKQAEKLLQTINQDFTNATTVEILYSKPMFDEDKVKLRAYLQRLEQYHNSHSRRCFADLDRLNENTDNDKWNAVSHDINKLIMTLNVELNLGPDSNRFDFETACAACQDWVMRIVGCWILLYTRS